jgi:hypothetical protein
MHPGIKLLPFIIVQCNTVVSAILIISVITLALAKVISFTGAVDVLTDVDVETATMDVHFDHL